MESGRAGHRAKGGSGVEKGLEAAMPRDAPPNGDAPTGDDPSGQDWVGPRRRVSGMQANLHRGVNQHHGRHHGEPVAVRAARRVRRAAWGNGPAAMPAPRPRPTPPSPTVVATWPRPAAWVNGRRVALWQGTYVRGGDHGRAGGATGGLAYGNSRRRRPGAGSIALVAAAGGHRATVSPPAGRRRWRPSQQAARARRDSRRRAACWPADSQRARGGLRRPPPRRPPNRFPCRSCSS